MAFVEQAMGLLSCPTDTDFRKQAGEIIRKFPKTASWLEWWLWPAHASMLFVSQRVMDLRYGILYPIQQMPRKPCTGSCMQLRVKTIPSSKVYALSGLSPSIMSSCTKLASVSFF